MHRTDHHSAPRQAAAVTTPDAQVSPGLQDEDATASKSDHTRPSQQQTVAETKTEMAGDKQSGGKSGRGTQESETRETSPTKTRISIGKL